MHTFDKPGEYIYNDCYSALAKGKIVARRLRLYEAELDMREANQISLTLGEEQRMFYQEHSLAISVFAHLEQNLCSFVADQAGKGSPTSSRSLKIAIAGIESFRAKLEFADRCVQVLLAQRSELLDQWSQVKRALETANTGRNKVVHFSKKTFYASPPGRRVVLIPPPMNPSAKDAEEAALESTTKEAPTYAIHLRRLVEIRYSAQWAYCKLGSLWGPLNGRPDPYADMPALQAPTLHQLISEYRRAVAVGGGDVPPRP